MEMISLWIAHYGYAAIFVLLMLGIVGLPIPDEWLLTFTGYLVFSNHLRLWPAVAVAVLGSMCGISASYGLGRSAGLFVIRHYGSFFRVTPQDMSRVHAWFDRFGTWTLLGGYFIPGVRHLTAIVAGTSKMEYPLFSIFAYSGALIWASTFIGLGYYFGEKWTRVLAQIERHSAVFAWIALMLILIFLFRWYRKKRRSNGVELLSNFFPD